MLVVDTFSYAPLGLNREAFGFRRMLGSVMRVESDEEADCDDDNGNRVARREVFSYIRPHYHVRR